MVVKEPKQRKIQKCYFCGEELLDSDLVIKPFPLSIANGSTRMYKRKFHFDCVPKYIEVNGNVEDRKEENNEWEEVADYFKVHILGQKPSSVLDKYSVLRLLGLRVGKFMPSGNNVRGLKRGYSFKTILYTMKFSKGTIIGLYNKSTLTDQEHKTNLALTIMTKNINFIDIKMKNLEKQNERTEDIEVKEIVRAPYRKQGGKKKFDFLNDDEF